MIFIRKCSVGGLIIYFFFFSSRRRHTRLQGDWSSDVCSSDLVYSQIVRVDLHVNLFGFGEDGDGDGGGVYAPARLGLRHALDAVDAGLVLESGVDLVALYQGDGLLDAAYSRLRRVEYLHAPALPLGVATVHPKHLRSEQCGLV